MREAHHCLQPFIKVIYIFSGMVSILVIILFISLTFNIIFQKFKYVSSYSTYCGIYIAFWPLKYWKLLFSVTEYLSFICYQPLLRSDQWGRWRVQRSFKRWYYFCLGFLGGLSFLIIYPPRCRFHSLVKPPVAPRSLKAERVVGPLEGQTTEDAKSH